MTTIGTVTAGLLAALAAAAGGGIGAAGGGLGAGEDGPAPAGENAVAGAPVALVVDAASGRAGRELVDPRLEAVDAEVRLPRTAAEARTNVRYFAELGYRLVVSGPRATAAAAAAGVPAERAAGLEAALRATAR